MRAISNILTKLLWIAGLALLIVPSLFAGGGRETETKISLMRPSTYISPSGPESARHTLDIDNIQLQIGKGGTIKRYDFSIYDKAGKVIFSKSAVQSSGKGFLGEAFNVGAKPVSLPTKFAWPGVDQDGKQVPDGEYFYQLTAIDSWGFPASTPPLAVEVDSVPPRITSVSLANSIISPDGDGQKDTLMIRSETGPAMVWTERVLGPDGKAVWSRETTFPGDTDNTDSPLPAQLVWDPAINSDGSARADKLAEGNYVYEMSGTDHAGNIAVKTTPFRISFAGSLISVQALDNVTVTNSDAGITLLPSLAETAGASAWSLEIVDSANVVWRRFQGKGLIPESLAFSGRGRAGMPDSDADRLKDGTYSVRVRQDYDSGFAATDQSFSFDMDSTPPSATLMLNTATEPTNPALHPWFGGERRKTLHIKLAVSEKLDWTMQLVNLDGRSPSFSIPVSLMASDDQPNRFEWQWDGTVPAGSRSFDSASNTTSAVSADEKLEDGRWAVLVNAKDAGGNEGETASMAFVFQAGPVGPLNLVQDAREISPGVAGAAEQVRLTVEGLNAPEVDQLVLTVLDPQDQEVYRKAFRPELPITWQGQQSNGLPAINGVYRLNLLAEYRNGDELGLSSEPVNLAGRGERKIVTESANEVIARAINLKVETPLLLDSANGEAVPVTFTALNSDGFPGSIAWSLKVLDEKGGQVWESSGTGTPAARIEWNGQKTDGSWITGLQRMKAHWEMSGAALDGVVTLDREFMTGIPVAAEGDRLRVLAPDIMFAGNNSDPFDGDADQIAGNIDLLRRLGNRLALVDDHRIVIEGYATYALGLTEDSMAKEQKNELIPLSRLRAHEIRKSLFTIGVDWQRMEIVALGGENPVAPYEDKTVAWKNRRAIIYLDK